MESTETVIDQDHGTINGHGAGSGGISPDWDIIEGGGEGLETAGEG